MLGWIHTKLSDLETSILAAVKHQRTIRLAISSQRLGPLWGTAASEGYDQQNFKGPCLKPEMAILFHLFCLFIGRSEGITRVWTLSIHIVSSQGSLIQGLGIFTIAKSNHSSQDKRPDSFKGLNFQKEKKARKSTSPCVNQFCVDRPHLRLKI